MRALNVALILALCSTALAYVSWQHPITHQHDHDVMILDLQANDISSIIWTEGASYAELKHDSDAWSVSLSQYGTKPGSEHLKSFLDGLLPLWGVRNLGQLTETQLTTLGLTPAKAQIVITEKDNGKRARLDIGNSNANQREVYVRVNDGDAYLMRASILSPLRYNIVALQEQP